MFNDGVATDTQKSNEYAFTNGGYYTMTAMTNIGSNTDNIFEREFKENVKSTLCPPFNISPTEAAQLNGKLYQLTGAANGIFTLKSCNSIEAFKPYVFIANRTEKSLHPFQNKALLLGNAIPATIGEYSFVGTMSKVKKVSTVETSYYIYSAANGSFVKANNDGGVVIPAYRCYFQTNQMQ
ncbi:alpha-amylase, partial [Prevotella melaninogenica]